MIKKIDKGDYYLIKSDSGKVRIKGSKLSYSEITEKKGNKQIIYYEEVD